MLDEISLGDINIYDIGNSIQISGTIWSGNGESFVTLFPGKQEDFSKLKLLPMSLEDWTRFLRQTDILETEIFSHEPSGIIKSIVRKTARQIDSYVQWAVFQRDQYSCRYCGRTGIPLTVDHIDLWENGGATVELNLIAACKPCNKDRGNTPYEEWINGPVYAKKSSNLSESVKQINRDVIAKLPELSALRVKNVRSR